MGRTRYADSQQAPLRQLPGSALRAVFAEGYSADDFRHDLLAGVVCRQYSSPTRIDRAALPF
jgi:hypothetical protein